MHKIKGKNYDDSITLIQMLVFSILIGFKQVLYNPHNLTKGKIVVLLTTSIIICSWSILLSHKKQFIALIITDALISVLILSDKVYFRYYSTPISIPVLYQTGLLGSLSDSIKGLLKVKDILYFLDFIVVIPLMSLLIYKNDSYMKKVTKQSLIHNIVSFLVIVCTCVVLILFRGFKVNASSPGLFSAIFNYNLIEQQMGILSFHGLDSYNYIINNIVGKDKLTTNDNKDIKQFFQENKNDINNNLYGIAKGKNLIIIQVEALQGFVINREVNGKEITPNLNNLAKENVYFNNFYTQVAGGNTSDAEFLTNTSLYPAREGAAYFRYPGNTFNSLPQLLKKEGYYTAAMHGYDPDFWNRRIMYKNLGFDKFFSDKDYNIDDKIGWGISDKAFLTQSLDKLNSLPKPFYSFIVTLSSHYPFNMFEEDKSFDVGNLEKTQVGNYIKAINYTDNAIGIFIQGLKDNGLYDNSVIVIYGDHDAIKSDKQDELDSFLGNNNSDLIRAQYKKVPLIIHIPHENIKNRDNVPAAQIDTMPTLLNLLAVNSAYTMGKDLLSLNSNIVAFRDNSFTDGNIFYLSNSNKAYDINTGKQIDSEKIKIMKEQVNKRLKISDMLLSNNWFRKNSGE